jgi:hypothetical protein
MCENLFQSVWKKAPLLDYVFVPLASSFAVPLAGVNISRAKIGMH